MYSFLAKFIVPGIAGFLIPIFTIVPMIKNHYDGRIEDLNSSIHKANFQIKKIAEINKKKSDVIRDLELQMERNASEYSKEIMRLQGAALDSKNERKILMKRIARREAKNLHRGDHNEEWDKVNIPDDYIARLCKSGITTCGNRNQ